MNGKNGKKELPELSRTVTSIAPSGIRRFFDIAAKMQDVVSLGVGEPDFVTPWTIREQAIYSLERGQTTYTSNYGLLELRKAISLHLSNLYGVQYDPEQEVMVTVGVSEGLDIAMRAILNPGDEVLVPEPCYVSYKPCVILAGGVPVTVRTTADTNFCVTPEQIEAVRTPKLKAILLGYPSNPTGATMPREAVQRIVDYANQHNLFIVTDEIYDRLVYEGSHTCVSSLPGARERTILLNGFSKAYAMTGWRIGYVCAPEKVLAAMVKIHAYTMLCAPITGQKAALEALKNGETALQDMVAQYNQRRRLIVDGLDSIGLECHMPQGAFYAFPKITATGYDAETFAERLLFDQKVAVVPGTAFGAGGEEHIRCSYATSTRNIELAIERIGAFLKASPKPGKKADAASLSPPSS
jgi:aminotransferase